MYNLFVSSSDESWDGEPFVLEIKRCIQEYTENAISEKYGKFTRAQINAIRRFPCIFAYEAYCKKDPKFGLIQDITKRQDQVKIDYKIIELDRFLTHSEILNMLFELDIGKWEMNRTHWAIKDVNLAKELSDKKIALPAWTRTDSKTIDITKHDFEVALSFPGGFREYVESIAEELERIIGPDSYFYDGNFIAQLARPSLDELLQDIYTNRSKLVVVFLCKEYQEKEWCGIEFRAVKDIIMKKQHERVMFVKLDEGDIDIQGVFKTDGYIDRFDYSPRQIAEFIYERVTLL